MKTPGEALLGLQERRELLAQVVGVFWASSDPGEATVLEAVQLAFERTQMLLLARADDSLEVAGADRLPVGPEYRLSNLSDLPPWERAIGRPLLFSWVLENSCAGYIDGVQMEFAHDVSAEPVSIQLVVFASEIKVRVVLPDFVDMPFRQEI